MAATTYTLTGNLANILGGTATKVRAYIENNGVTNGVALIDFAADETRLPAPERIVFTSGNAFSLQLIGSDSSGINISGGTLRWRVRVLYADREGNEYSWNSGWFAMTGNADLSDKTGGATIVPVDAAAAAAAALVEDAVERALETHTPGIDLGTKSRDSVFETTNTDISSTAGDIPELAVAIVGQGRPVELEFVAPKVQHSVAGQVVNVSITVDGNAFSPVGSTYATSAPSSSNIALCTGVTAKRVTLPLQQGVTYVFGVRIWGSAAGTSKVNGAVFGPLQFIPTSR